MLMRLRTWSRFSSITSNKGFSPCRATDRVGLGLPQDNTIAERGTRGHPYWMRTKKTLKFHLLGDCLPRCSSCVFRQNYTPPVVLSLQAQIRRRGLGGSAARFWPCPSTLVFTRPPSNALYQLVQKPGILN